MSADQDPIERLLASITDGSSPEWDAPDRSGDAGQRSRLESLRDVSRIAEFSRELQRAVEEGAPERWGDLLILERLGSGAHAEVHRAWDPALRREVALKLMRPAADDTVLLEEARVAARIRHPHVVTIHGVDRKDGRVGLWMELVRGPTVEQDVRVRGPLGPTEAKRLGFEIGGALTAVHAASLLHRDVKPANIVRDAEGRYVLADFGLGLRRDAAASEARVPSGTPMFMAPEILAGAPPSERSDVYALGMTLWFALAGSPPFESETLEDLIDAVRRGPRPTLRERRPDVPASLAAIIDRAIAPDPALRFASARRMVEALEPSNAKPARSWDPMRALATGAIVVALAASGIALWRASQKPGAAPRAVASLAAPVALGYDVEATFLRRDARRTTPLVTGDHVKPGDRLGLEVRASRPTWVYVLDEDERGERYLLFPQPRFDARNPIAAESTVVLPGTVGGKEQAWTVTSAGGREYLLVVASPEPVAEIEADLERLPAPEPGRPIDYARVGDATVERLRGVGGLSEMPAPAATPATTRSRAFDRFRSLAGRESGVHGVWVRQIVLENPRR